MVAEIYADTRAVAEARALRAGRARARHSRMPMWQSLRRAVRVWGGRGSLKRNQRKLLG